MDPKIQSLQSAHLGKEMKIAEYGHYGVNILLFPTQSDDFLEAEKSGLLGSISHFLDSGRCKVYSVDGVNFESWLNNEISPEARSKRHFEYDKFICEEVVPYIFENSGGAVPIITCGASIGAFHAANTYFKRPDIFLGTIAMSGTFNIQHYSGDFFDENCYFNSPIHYIPNLNDSYWLSFLKSRHHVFISSGSGVNEYPHNSVHIGEILSSKGIPHLIDIWGDEWGHDIETWKKMLPYFIENKL